MKKQLLMAIILCTSIMELLAQRFEVISEYKFNEPISYYETWDVNEGSNPGISCLMYWKGKLIAYDGGKNTWMVINNPKNRYSYENFCPSYLYDKTEEYLIIGEANENDKVNIYIKSNNLDNPDYIFSLSEPTGALGSGFYQTEDMLFAKNTNNGNLIFWELKPEGKYVYHDSDETRMLLEEGLGERLGLYEEGSQTYYFGETCMTDKIAPDYRNYWKEVNIKTESYKSLGSLRRFGCLGTDKHGLSYYYYFKKEKNFEPFKHPEVPITIAFALLDPWTHEVNVIELPPGDWNPTRNSEGLLAVCSWCMDDDGNIYFTDCNKEKGVYQIKKLDNGWTKKYGYDSRTIGRMNANHIPLQTEADPSANNNGYNFDHEYLWVLEQGDEWWKVRKVDGREGWVESKYIVFE